MNLTISSAAEAKLREKARAKGISVEEYVECLIREDEEWTEWHDDSHEMSNAELNEVRAAINEGLEQPERGEGAPAEQVFAPRFPNLFLNPRRYR